MPHVFYLSAKKLYPSALEEFGGPKITILRRKENVGNADLLHEVPEELRVYRYANLTEKNCI